MQSDDKPENCVLTTSKTTTSPVSMIPVAVQSTTTSKPAQINVFVSEAKAGFVRLFLRQSLSSLSSFLAAE
ncbi:hypothetical protein BCR33DRAFT_359153 [Rhizoclosmatium globosum]|uniref:Uncharacterized protein n=1 Tax=Rhizoclosmatium globosum TaxID=329046 RepID=A0A1Y2C1N0_9FUNG|nr:hypothetical protein BCR33DRAFT_359153 [Rhizoclosmatium globosum]|eukprot:ORY40804.1 hypothetical protein BCR33DRAFT_359153 [Rhizoclosmatium globosum]